MCMCTSYLRGFLSTVNTRDMYILSFAGKSILYFTESKYNAR